MAVTNWKHRLIVIAPVAALTTLGQWWSQNVDSSDDTSTWVSLNATGLMADPETHRGCNTALTEALARSIMVRVCNLATVTPPTLGTWNGWNKAQKYAWLAATRNQLHTNTGVWLDLADNEGTWTDPQGVAAARGLQVRRPPPAGVIP
jgi:hypothetical protein